MLCAGEPEESEESSTLLYENESRPLRPEPRRAERFAPAPRKTTVVVRQTPAHALVELNESALLLGQVCFPLEKIRTQLGTAIARRLCQRLGSFIRQTAAFSLDNFPCLAAEQLLPGNTLDLTTPHVKTWKATNQAQVTEMIGSLLARSSYSCADATRALQTASERVIRVIATIIPSVEISWVDKNNTERLFVNFQYVLADEDGELHHPKDAEGVEIEMEDSDEVVLRQAMLSAVLAMHSKGFPLAPGFLRQLGKMAEANRVEAMLSNPFHPPAHPMKNGKVRVNRLEGSPFFEVEAIVDERPSRGKAEVMFLVRWVGYHPSWEAWRVRGEVGSPVESWEPMSTMRNTEALQTWRESQSLLLVDH